LRSGILKNTLLNLAGLGLPLIAALLTIPYLIEKLGNEKFGILTLIWALISYASIFDFGLGRAVTLLCSANNDSSDEEKSEKIIGCALHSVIIIGFFVFLSFLFLGFYFKIFSSSISDEFVNAFLIMSFGIIPTMLIAILRGVLEYQGRFLILNLIRIPMGLSTFLGPVFSIIIFGDSLVYITWVLALSKLLFMIIMFFVISNIIKIIISNGFYFNKKIFRELLRQGGWMTVSNIVSPLMSYIDRFMIATFSGAKSVAFYVTPQEIVTKITLLPTAITAVLFPLLSRKDDKTLISYKSIKILTSSIVLLIVCLVFIFSELLLTIWINEDFSNNSYRLLQVMIVGVFFTCIAQFPYTVIQSRGKSNITALIHLTELPFYIVLLYIMINCYGALGAAIAWSIRNVVDYFIMLWCSKIEYK